MSKATVAIKKSKEIAAKAKAEEIHAQALKDAYQQGREDLAAELKAADPIGPEAAAGNWFTRLFS